MIEVRKSVLKHRYELSRDGVLLLLLTESELKELATKCLEILDVEAVKVYTTDGDYYVLSDSKKV